MHFRLLIFLFTSLPLFAQQASVDFTGSNLPIIRIDTDGLEIPTSDPRISADMDIISNGDGQRNEINDPANNYSGKISIEIRGESSAGWSFKSYSIETQNTDGTNRNVSLLGLPEENDWILYAPVYDRSLIRNALSYHLARKMGWYAPRTVFCELVLNGDYQGIYVLTEKIKRDKNRVDIATLNPDEVSGADLTGGYIIRVDKEDWKPSFPSAYPPSDLTAFGIRYQYYYPSGENIAPEQESYIQHFIREFEDVMYGENFSDPDSGYTRYLNVDSFVDYVILNELSRNVDGYRLSTYLTKQKDSDGGKLLAGPVWDYNFSFGNVDYNDADKVDGWQLLYFAEDENFSQFDPFQSPFWWKVLFNDHTFRQKLRVRWTELRQQFLATDSLFNTMQHFSEITDEARSRNFEIRPKPGSTELGEGWFPNDPRSELINSYEDELSVTQNWISDRAAWIDANLPLLVANEYEEQPLSFVLYQNYPNPFNPSTTISFELPASSFVSLAIYNVQGRLVKELISKTLIPGTHHIKFDAGNLSTGVYFYSIQTEQFRQTRRMLLIK